MIFTSQLGSTVAAHHGRALVMALAASDGELDYLTMPLLFLVISSEALIMYTCIFYVYAFLRLHSFNMI